MAVVVGKHGLASQSQRPSAGQRVGSDAGAGNLFLAVDTVRVASQRVDARLAVESYSERRQKSSSLKAPTRSSIRSSACNPAASGTGCAASMISMRLHGTA